VPLLSELVGTPDTRLSSHPLFVQRSRRANASTQGLRARFFHRATHDNNDLLAAEELLIDLLRRALAADTRRLAPTAATRRLIRRAKLFLDGHSSLPLRLGDVARAAGTSPAYLTDVFSRFEGISLHKYLIQSRLAKALFELPYADDLSQLALGLGFSSHSHFTASFRRAFGSTPSAFRQLTYKAQQKRLADIVPPGRTPMRG
jgi:AraC family transcriptional regulator